MTLRSFFRLPETWLLLLVVIVLGLLALTTPAHANGSNHHNGGDVDVRVENDNRSSSSSRADSNASARADADVDIDSHDTYKGDDYEAAASSAAIYLEGCNQGAAGQAMSFGVALGGESRFCQYLRLAEAHRAAGQPYEGMRYLRLAAAELNGGAMYPHEAPITQRISRWVRFNVTQPLLGWLPIIGHAI